MAGELKRDRSYCIPQIPGCQFHSLKTEKASQLCLGMQIFNVLQQSSLEITAGRGGGVGQDDRWRNQFWLGHTCTAFQASQIIQLKPDKVPFEM